MRFYGIRRRWLFSSFGVLLLIIVTVVLAFSVSIASYYYSSMQFSLESKAKASSEFFVNYVSNTKADYYPSVQKYTDSFDERDSLELQFVDTSGKVQVSTYGITAGTSPRTADIQQAVSSGEISSWRGSSPDTGEHIMAISSPIIVSDGTVVGVMRYVTSLAPLDHEIRVNMFVAIGCGMAVIVVTFLTNLLFISTIVEPVTKITAMANRISEGSFGIQLEHKRKDEIGDLTDAINNMSMKLNQSEKLKTEFISSVSHELRTPLTAITGWGETLLYDESLSQDQRRGLEIIYSEAKRLTNLVEEMLEFTRMEDGRFTLNVRQMNITDELENAIFSYSEYLRHDGIDLDYMSYEGEIPDIPGDPERLRQVFYNILDNASKHGKEGGKIRASIDVDDDYVYIHLRDYGPGIPEDELDNVKMKFYKGSSKERGNGIGLAVCEEIIGYHNGELILENADPGLEVTIKLPLK